MKRYFALALLGLILLAAGCSGEAANCYDSTLDPYEQLEEAKRKVASDGRQILLQVGGNWCKWCVRLNRVILGDQALHDTLDKHFVWLHINYGKDMHPKSKSFLEALGNPQQNGVPVLVVLDGDGEVLLVKNTAELEEGDGYSREALMAFFGDIGWVIPLLRETNPSGHVEPAAQ